jgi:hypothetical protein
MLDTYAPQSAHPQSEAHNTLTNRSAPHSLWTRRTTAASGTAAASPRVRERRWVAAIVVSLLAATGVAGQATSAQAATQGGSCSAPLGGVYNDVSLVVPACGPRPDFGGSTAPVHPYPGSLTTPGYQCVELSERFLYYKDAVTMPISTNGNQVVDHYVARYPSMFEAVANGTAGRVPVQGDVLSLDTVTGFNGAAGGHTAIVQSSSVNSAGTGSIVVIEENNSAVGQQTLTVSNWHVAYPGFSYIKWLHPRAVRDNRAVMVRHHGAGGYTVAPNGSITAFGGAPALAPSATWPGQDIVRAAVLRSDDLGGYVLDLFGGIHPFGNAPAVGGSPYWPGWDIARDLVLRSNNTSGYVLDGYGGVHPFGGAPAVSASAYWSGWDIATGIAGYDDNGGYVLDGYGGIHPYGDAPAVSGSAYWSGWNIARAIITTHDGLGAGGYVLDGYGGMHPFGDASPVAVAGYHGGIDTAVAATITANGATGWEVDANGNLSAVTGPTPACKTCS